MRIGHGYICWALIGQWTSRELFPPPKGKWPRNGHPEKLLNHFAERRPPILTWAHSSFEQGSLPSMLHLPGEAVLMILPGDRMFQAQCIVQQRCRPAILHGYARHALVTDRPCRARLGPTCNCNGREAWMPSRMVWGGPTSGCRYVSGLQSTPNTVVRAGRATAADPMAKNPTQ